jgi:hypothetical protein
MTRYHQSEIHAENTEATEKEAFKKHYCSCAAAWPSSQKRDDHIARQLKTGDPKHTDVDPEVGVALMRLKSLCRFDRQCGVDAENVATVPALETFQHLTHCRALKECRAKLGIAEGRAFDTDLELDAQVLLLDGFRKALEAAEGRKQPWFQT